ncbi:hypothetical protein [Halomicrobium salinisoli]|uniref:hypothetical protein n=1 Tax=Halomicrobium salinisoli TaxID=2878391 RepID=UPI001CF0B703|nr:hypothetical protein [Halomicrobium salinisoli]
MSDDDEDDGPPPETVETLARRLDALSTQTENLRESLREAREERAELREEVESLRSENAELRRELERLDARTDLLELVESADSMDADQRATALVQHLQRAAERQRERGGLARASVSREEAETALHHPDVDRTTIYDDMRRAVRFVGNEDVLWYDSDTGGESRLKLDLEAGELPSGITGRSNDHRGR